MKRRARVWIVEAWWGERWVPTIHHDLHHVSAFDTKERALAEAKRWRAQHPDDHFMVRSYIPGFLR